MNSAVTVWSNVRSLRLCTRCAVVAAGAVMGTLLLPMLALVGAAVYVVLLAGMGVAMIAGMLGPACRDVLDPGARSDT